MNHNQKVNWLTEILTPPLAIISSFVALLLAVGQLTAPARLRRESVYWSERKQATRLQQDRDVIESFERLIMARLIALKLIPGRSMVGAAYLFVAGIAATFSAFYTLGEIVPEPITRQSLEESGLDVFVFLLLLPLVLGGLIGMIGVLTRRRRLVRKYLDGLHIADEPIGFTDEGGIWLGFHLNATGWTRLGAFALGVCGLTGSVGFVFGAQTINLEPFAPWAALWFLMSLGLLFLNLGVVSVLHRAEREPVVHPRPLTNKAKVPIEAETIVSTVGHRLGPRWTWLLSVSRALPATSNRSRARSD